MLYPQGTNVNTPFFQKRSHNLGTALVSEYKVSNLYAGNKVGTGSQSAHAGFLSLVPSDPLPATPTFQNAFWRDKIAQICTQLQVGVPKVWTQHYVVPVILTAAYTQFGRSYTCSPVYHDILDLSIFLKVYFLPESRIQCAISYKSEKIRATQFFYYWRFSFRLVKWKIFYLDGYNIVIVAFLQERKVN